MNTRRSAHSVVSLTTLVVMVIVSVNQGFAQLSPKNEEELLAILRSDAPKAEKALACKHLSVNGSSAAAKDLAKLLDDEQLASWSRIALEAIPGDEIDEALRAATKSLEGKLLVGVINSIGVRRDEAAVELLSERLDDKDAEVASAAAVALGRIGNAEAASPLRKALAGSPEGVRSAIAEGCVLCAERFLAAGDSTEATAIYDEVRKADVPRQRIIEATRGAILARGKDGILLLLEQLRSEDKSFLQIGLTTAREFPGDDLDQALAAELDQTSPERAALIVSAMADRTESVNVAAIQKAAEGGPPQVRLAAVQALGRVGSGTSLATLLDAALASDKELSAAAKEALIALQDESVDKEIASLLSKAEGKTYPLLIEIAGERRIEANDALLKASKHSDPAVRAAALKSLGNTIPQEQLSVLIKHVVAGNSEDAEVAQAALKTAAIRMPDREAAASELAAAADRARGPTKTVLLETVAAVGGMKALAAVSAAAKSSDAMLQDVGSRLLGDWATVDAAPVLLGLAKGDGKYQNRALRGYIGMARKMQMSEQDRAEMCKNALAAARQPAEQKLVLEVLTRHPNLESLKVAIAAMQTPELTKDASEAARAIAQKASKTDEVKRLLSNAGLEK